jgi:hypothetical protein
MSGLCKKGWASYFPKCKASLLRHPNQQVIFMNLNALSLSAYVRACVSCVCVWLTSLYYGLRVASEKGRDQNKFHCRKRWGCVKSCHRHETKLALHWFTLSPDSVLIRKWLNIKLADHFKKSVNVKRIMCQKISSVTFMVPNLRLWWLNMQNKQIAVNLQESTLSLKVDIWRWKQQKPELISSTWKFSFVQIQRQ